MIYQALPGPKRGMKTPTPQRRWQRPAPLIPGVEFAAAAGEPVRHMSRDPSPVLLAFASPTCAHSGSRKARLHHSQPACTRGHDRAPCCAFACCIEVDPCTARNRAVNCLFCPSFLAISAAAVLNREEMLSANVCFIRVNFFTCGRSGFGISVRDVATLCSADRTPSRPPGAGQRGAYL